MPPPDKTSDAQSKALLQTYLNSFSQQSDAAAAVIANGCIAVNGSGEEEADTGVTYFVDEEGRYYYQASGDTNNLVSLPSNVAEDAEGIGEDDAQMLVDSEGYQTVTLLPSESSTGEVSYVLVVQEENKPVVGIDIKVDQEEKAGNEDVYNFEDEEEAVEEDGSDEVDDSNKKPPKRSGKYNRPQLVCNFCSYTSHRRYLLLRHMRSHSEERPHKCKVCERGFKTLASLQNHLNMHNGVKPHICKYCKSPFTTSGELVRHVRYRHTHEKPHKCKECDYASVELSKLRRHMRCHTGERPYQCSHCTYASPDTFKLKRHLRTHTGEKPYKCEHCNMCFTQSNSLKSHKLIHNVTDKPYYKCELCPAKCGRKTDLRIHVQKLHTSDKPLKCRRCGKSFPDRYSCKLHNKTHVGEKCFKCDLCPYASTTLRHLKSHLLKHMDEKPFQCDQCDQSFRQKQLLKRHQNIYHNPDYEPKPPKEKTHTCRECNRAFAHKGNLIRHLAVHDPESGHQERALALKLGRQKKVKVVNTQQSNEEAESDTEQPDNLVKFSLNNDLKRGELVTVADSDGQQYVVLEVIQLEDGTEQQVAVVAPDYEQDEDEEMDSKKNIQHVQMRSKEQKKQKNMNKSVELEREVDSCFGFDEDDPEEEEEDDEEYNEKVVLSLV